MSLFLFYSTTSLLSRHPTFFASQGSDYIICRFTFHSREIQIRSKWQQVQLRYVVSYIDPTSPIHLTSQPLTHLTSQPLTQLTFPPLTHLASQPLTHLPSPPLTHLTSPPLTHFTSPLPGTLMDGLTAKVCRTYNASWTLQQQLKEQTDPKSDLPNLVLTYNRANRAVAVLCNHQVCTVTILNS